MMWRRGSSPVISRSIQASIMANLAATKEMSRGRYLGGVLEIPTVLVDDDLRPPSYARAGDAGADLVARKGAVVRGRRRPSPGPHRGAGGHTRGLRRIRPAPERVGLAPRDHGGQQPWSDRRRLPRRDIGDRHQH